MGRRTLPTHGAALLLALALAAASASAADRGGSEQESEARRALALGRWAFERDVQDYAEARAAAPIGSQVPLDLSTSIGVLREAYRQHPQSKEIQRALAFALSVDNRLEEAAAVLGERSDPKLRFWFRCAAGATVRPVPRLASAGLPTYPEQERLERVQGIATLQIVVNPDGTLKCGRVLHATTAGFAVAALETIQHWHYMPLRAGERRHETGIVIIDYRLE